MTQSKETAGKSNVRQFPRRHAEKNLPASDVKKTSIDITALDKTLNEILRDSKAVWARGVL